jgi:PAS domain S-box-containing protein
MNRTNEDPSYRLFFEAAPDAILVVDDSGIIRMNNAKAEVLLDASSGELLGMNVDSLVPLSSRKTHAQRRSGFVKSASSRPMGIGLALHAIKLSGRQFPVEISLSNTSQEGRSETIVVMRDISERLAARRTENELRRSKTLTALTELALRERDFQSLSDQVVTMLLEPLSADLVLLKDCLSNNEQVFVRSAFGDSAETLRGLLIERSKTPLEQRFPVLVSDSTINDQTVFPIAVKLGFRSLISAPLFLNGEVVGAICMGSHTAHRFTLDDIAFVEAITNIISTAIGRSGAEQKLMDSMRLESLGQLTGGIAHDFNNLLTVISGNLQLLALPGMGKSEQERAIAAAQRAARNGADLTAKLLAFSRVQSLRPTQVDIEQLLNSFRELLVRTLGVGIQIDLVTAPDLPAILVDSAQLESALLNLLVNARDAMPDGGQVIISASLENGARLPVSEPFGAKSSGNFVKISVQDTGQGMSEAVVDRIFEPFYTTKAVGKGSGLGLSMVHGFIKQSGGHISVKSKLGTGTRFDLYLPALTEDKTVHPPTTEPLLARGNQEKILIIDDDQAVLNVANQFFLALGYQTITATTQDEAIQQLKQNDDTVLVFSDVVLANGETGPQVCESLIALKPTLRILFTSGYEKSNLKSHPTFSANVELLHKPYTLEALALAVKRTLS